VNDAYQSQIQQQKSRPKIAETEGTGGPEQLRTSGKRHGKSAADIIDTDIWGIYDTTLSPELEVPESHDILHDFQEQAVSGETPTHQHHNPSIQSHKR